MTFDPVKSDLTVRAAQALEAGDAATAEGLYRQALTLYPADPARHADLGACLFVQGRYDEARAAYGRLLDIDSRSADAFYGLGCVDYKERRYREARDHLVRAVEVREGHGLTHLTLARVYDHLRERAKARTHYERAVALNPRFATETDVREWLAAPPP